LRGRLRGEARHASEQVATHVHAHIREAGRHLCRNGTCPRTREHTLGLQLCFGKPLVDVLAGRDRFMDRAAVHVQHRSA
jgi:hypothetical protein